jgi:hypothetical protein
MAAVRPARIIGYDRVIPPLVLLVDRHHVRSRRLGDGFIIKPMAARRTPRSCFHSADCEALGPPDSRDGIQTWSIWI